MKTKLLTFIICFFINNSFSQSLAKWGELRNYEREMIVCAFDSTAEAVILSDFENIEVSGVDPLTIRRHKRIKILNENAKGHANIVIPYFHEDGVDKITSISAQTLNIENGEVIKIALKKKDFFRVKVNESFSELRFTFPDVKVGSIVEFSYILQTKRYNSFTGWAFQNSLPTLFSKVSAQIDHRFLYRISYQGTRLQQKYKEGSHNSWLLKNLPKIEREPHCPNYHDYIEKVNFQLESYITNLGTKEIVMKTWEEFAKSILERPGFTKILGKRKKGEKIVAGIINNDDSPKEKVKKIFDHVSSNYEWNGYSGIIPEMYLNELITLKTGAADEINTFLVLLLRSAGFAADPVLISTKDHGFIAKSSLFMDQFNMLICNVKLDGKDLLLDASKGSRPLNLMYRNNLNLHGFLVHKKKPRWVEIPVDNKTRTIKLVTMNLENPEEVKYKFEVSSRSYDAFDMRNEIKASGINKYIISELIRENAEISIDSVSTRDLNNIEKPTFIKTFITDKSLCVINDDFVYLNPFVDAFSETDLFTAKERKLPIDLYYPWEEGYILNLTISEDYEVVEIPESMNLKLPGDKGYIKFNSSLNNNKIQIHINFIFKDSFFSPGEYPYLKEMYDLYIEKRQEQIVLKKKT
jgi:Domain of Unknown Function with PDB structure (DUF3857)/Transglutaminase-like superfamily